MTTQKITLAFISLLTACIFQACNGARDKNGIDTEKGQPTKQSQTAGNDTSHTTDNRRNEVSGVNSQPAGTSGNQNANGSTTAQGMTGADSVYQKSTQKSQR